MRTRALQRERNVFVKLLREAREEAALRQCDLARKLERSQSYVSKIESGEVGVDIFELRRICSAMGICTIKFVAKLDSALPNS
jgi:ribosome-binding protein aMBF1 (putative translation factor)